MKNWTIYLSLSIVFVASIAAASFAPVSEFISGMIVVPGVGALEF
jgi:hypothetical protein